MITMQFDEFLRRYPLARLLPGFTPSMAVFLEMAVMPVASEPCGPFGSADLLFSVRRQPFYQGLAKPDRDILSRVAAHVARVAGDRLSMLTGSGRPLQAIIRAADGSDRARITATVPDRAGEVGLFFAVPDASGVLHLLVRSVPLRHADVDSDNLTINDGHDTVWSGLVARGVAGLAAQVSHPYYHFPRGQMVYDVVRDRFTILADKRLKTPDVTAEIKRAFAVGATPCSIIADHRYVSGVTLPTNAQVTIRKLIH